VLDNPRVRRTATLLLVAVLAALVVIQTFTTGHRVVLDARAAGLAAAAVIAVVVRAPFLVVVALACLTTALVRLWA
jgi:asparagine N-glycosylation enzyme membrane subunit Stt3